MHAPQSCPAGERATGSVAKTKLGYKISLPELYLHSDTEEMTTVVDVKLPDADTVSIPLLRQSGMARRGLDTLPPIYPATI